MAIEKKKREDKKTKNDGKKRMFMFSFIDIDSMQEKTKEHRPSRAVSLCVFH